MQQEPLNDPQRLDRVLGLLARRAQALVQARGAAVLLAGGDGLRVAAAAGDAPAPGTRFAGPAGEGDRSTLLVALVHGDRRVGALAALGGRDDGDFEPEDVRRLEAFAAQAAAAVASAARAEEERLRRALDAAEAERRRWARELHDETLQGLAGVRVLLASAARGEDPEAMRAAMRDAAQRLAGEIEGLRAIIADLRPAALDQLGLEPALRTLVRRQADAHGIQIRASVETGGVRLRPELETGVYRVVQEALTNVAKHARARHAEVRVRAQDGWLLVRVADDGVGVAGGDGGEAGLGFGVIGMRERVALLGGELRVDARDDGATGTIVRAALPLEPRAYAPTSPWSSA